MKGHDKQTLLKELAKSELLYIFPKGNNQNLPHVAFTTNINQSQTLMEEIGLLRKTAFEHVGVPVRGELDLDKHDLRHDNPYNSFFIWDQDNQRIVSSYRYLIPTPQTTPEELALAEVFTITKEYEEQYMYETIDLGRSFVIPELQVSSSAKEALTVFNKTFTVLGKIYAQNKDTMTGFGGKITHKLPPKTFGTPEEFALNLSLSFLDEFKEKGLLEVKVPYTGYNIQMYTEADIINIYENEWKRISKHSNNLIMTYYNSAKERGQRSKLKTFGTGTYPETNTGYNGIETAIIIKFDDISAKKQQYYLQPHFQDTTAQDEIAKDFNVYKGIELRR